MLCIHCGKNAFSLSMNNLCEICEYRFLRNVQIAKESAIIINTTKNIDTFINRCKIALDILERLKEFEHLNLVEPPPAKIIDNIIEKRTDTIFEHLSKYYIELHQKLDDVDSVERIITIIEKAKINYAKYLVYILNQEKFQEINSNIEFLISHFITGRHNNLVSDARYYEKKGEAKLALKKLNKALKEFKITKNYFPERDQNLDSELKNWIESIAT